MVHGLRPAANNQPQRPGRWTAAPPILPKSGPVCRRGWFGDLTASHTARSAGRRADFTFTEVEPVHRPPGSAFGAIRCRIRLATARPATKPDKWAVKLTCGVRRSKTTWTPKRSE